MVVSQGAIGKPVTQSADVAQAIDSWRPKQGLPWTKIGLHAVLIFWCTVVLFPLLWVVLLSLKSLPDAYQRWIWPKDFIEPLFNHYKWVWTERGTVRTNFANSVLVTVGTVICATVVSVLAGYALVHLNLSDPASAWLDQRDMVADPALHSVERGNLNVHHARHL
jgi:ABC-type glycerol-3-phosphate transport system permease component